MKSGIVLWLTSSLIWLSFNVLSFNNPSPTFCRLTDDQVRVYMIYQSWQNYPGNCPCPYSQDAIGHTCGGRSAYTRPGGYSPLCYHFDISREMVRAFKKQNCGTFY